MSSRWSLLQRVESGPGKPVISISVFPSINDHGTSFMRRPVDQFKDYGVARDYRFRRVPIARYFR